MSDLISRQQAINVLDVMCHTIAEKEVRKGVSMAWEQIKDLPSAQAKTITTLEYADGFEAGYRSGLNDARRLKKSAQPEVRTQMSSADCISRQAAIMHFIKASKNYECGMFDLKELTHELWQMPSAQPERKTEKALRLLLEWAIECDFGYDNIPEEYEKYKDDIEGMSYTDGLIYIAKMEVEHE